MHIQRGKGSHIKVTLSGGQTVVLSHRDKDKRAKQLRYALGRQQRMCEAAQNSKKKKDSSWIDSLKAVDTLLNKEAKPETRDKGSSSRSEHEKYSQDHQVRTTEKACKSETDFLKDCNQILEKANPEDCESIKQTRNDLMTYFRVHYIEDETIDKEIKKELLENLSKQFCCAFKLNIKNISFSEKNGEFKSQLEKIFKKIMLASQLLTSVNKDPEDLIKNIFVSMFEKLNLHRFPERLSSLLTIKKHFTQCCKPESDAHFHISFQCDWCRYQYLKHELQSIRDMKICAEIIQVNQRLIALAKKFGVLDEEKGSDYTEQIDQCEVDGKKATKSMESIGLILSELKSDWENGLCQLSIDIWVNKALGKKISLSKLYQELEKMLPKTVCDDYFFERLSTLEYNSSIKSDLDFLQTKDSPPLYAGIIMTLVNATKKKQKFLTLVECKYGLSIIEAFYKIAKKDPCMNKKIVENIKSFEDDCRYMLMQNLIGNFLTIQKLDPYTGNEVLKLALRDNKRFLQMPQNVNCWLKVALISQETKIKAQNDQTVIDFLEQSKKELKSIKERGVTEYEETFSDNNYLKATLLNVSAFEEQWNDIFLLGVNQYLTPKDTRDMDPFYKKNIYAIFLKAFEINNNKLKQNEPNKIKFEAFIREFDELLKDQTTPERNDDKQLFRFGITLFLNMKLLFDMQKEKAAIKIQSVVKGHLTREAINLDLLKYESVSLIQRHWRDYKDSKSTRKTQCVILN